MSDHTQMIFLKDSALQDWDTAVRAFWEYFDRLSSDVLDTADVATEHITLDCLQGHMNRTGMAWYKRGAQFNVELRVPYSVAFGR